MPAGSVHTGGFPHEGVLNLKSYSVVDDVSMMNADGSETPIVQHQAVVSLHITWHNPHSAPVSISGMTEPTLLPPDLVPGTPAEPQQSFNGEMNLTQATGNFEAQALGDDGSVLASFKATGVKSDFAEFGAETVGSP